MKMLNIKDLTVFADNKEILKNFDLNINDGEIHCIMGPNGVGKSTICRAILKDPNYSITNGNITYKEKNLKDSAIGAKDAGIKYITIASELLGK